MLNRQALEDAVYSAYPDLHMSAIERLPSEKLEYLLGAKQGRWKIPRAKKTSEAEAEAKAKTVWRKIGECYEVRGGVLVHVESWRVSNDAGQDVREYVQQCGERVVFEGRTRSASIVAHYLTTGEWVKRIPKPRRIRAIVRDGARVVHLGYFATVEEREAAVFAYRLGITPRK
jgi:hypothetical protein